MRVNNGTMSFATDFSDGFYHRGADPVRWRFTVAPGATTRVVLTWNATGTPGPGFSDMPDADLDLWIYDGQGQLMATSSSWDRVVESVLVTNTGSTAAVFDARVRLWSNTSASTWFGLAFQPTADAHTCPGQCVIGGACVEDGAVSPENPCLCCNVMVSANDWSPLDGPPCDDGDLCTVADTCLGGACTGDEWPTCHDPEYGLICLVSGSEGEEVECPLRLARKLEEALPAAALQLVFHFDTRLASTTLTDGVHPVLGLPWTIPDPFSALQRGHSVAMLPGDPSTWLDSGAMLLVDLQDPYHAISDAWIGPEGTLHGDPDVLHVRFLLLDDILPETPAEVWVRGLSAAAGPFSPLPVHSDALMLRTTDPNL